MGEFYLDDGCLVSEYRWGYAVRELCSRVEQEPFAPFEELEREWLRAFERAVLERAHAAGSEPIGVLFSGGIDSTLIAFALAKNRVPFTCYTIGFKDPRTKDPEDIIEAREAAERSGWTHRELVLDLEAMEPVIRETVRVLGDAANPVTVGVGAVVAAGARLAAADGVRVLFSGLGSEELFAGYHRHGTAKARGGDEALDMESWRGLLKMHGRDLVRDTRIADALGIRLHTPFLDPRVITPAMRMSPELKIKGDVKKYVLREMAVDYGLPHDLAFRPKRAAQYGSRMHKAIARLAKRAGKTEIPYIDALRDELSTVHKE